MSHTSNQTTIDIMDYMEAYHPSKNAELINKEGYNESPCYRLISDEQAKHVAKMGGTVGISFVEWMIDGIWPDDIAPKHAADMLNHAREVIGVDHIAIATDDLFTTKPVVAFFVVTSNCTARPVFS